MIGDDKHWMIWTPLSRWAPADVFDTAEAAQAEAERRARGTPGVKYFVLGAEAVVQFDGGELLVREVG